MFKYAIVWCSKVGMHRTLGNGPELNLLAVLAIRCELSIEAGSLRQVRELFTLALSELRVVT